MTLRRIAVRACPGNAPGLFWLGGFNSDMKGTKALPQLDAWVGSRAQRPIRLFRQMFRRRAFIDGNGRWLEESVAVFSSSAAGRRS